MWLSVDWDYYTGMREHVFDSPFWGTSDGEYQRHDRWLELCHTRGGTPFECLREDFPLYGDPLELLQFMGLPCWVMLSHESAYSLLEHKNTSRTLINLDSHHDLYSSSGNPQIIRAGNWAGHALTRGLISNYTCIYPQWHSQVMMTEGYDLERTWQEMGEHTVGRCFDRQKVHLERQEPTDLTLLEISGIFLVQSPAWTNPLYDPIFFELCEKLQARVWGEGLRLRVRE